MYQKIILASGSPRRRELFTKLGINFQYITSDTKEEFNDIDPIENQVMKIASIKAYNVARIYDEAFIMGADTIVYCENRVLGKPVDPGNAFEMLRFLSGKKHESDNRGSCCQQKLQNT